MMENLKLLSSGFDVNVFNHIGQKILLFIVLFESALLYFLFVKSFKEKKVFLFLILSNIVGAVIDSGIKYLGFQFVTYSHIDPSEVIQFLFIIQLMGFVVALGIEVLLNVVTLKNNFAKKTIIKNTIIVNGIGYVIGALSIHFIYEIMYT
jgi:hypothetical protein